MESLCKKKKRQPGVGIYAPVQVSAPASQQLPQENVLESPFYHPPGTHTLRARGSISVAMREEGIRTLGVPPVLKENRKADVALPRCTTFLCGVPPYCQPWICQHICNRKSDSCFRINLRAETAFVSLFLHFYVSRDLRFMFLMQLCDVAVLCPSSHLPHRHKMGKPNHQNMAPKCCSTLLASKYGFCFG